MPSIVASRARPSRTSPKNTAPEHDSRRTKKSKLSHPPQLDKSRAGGLEDLIPGRNQAYPRVPKPSRELPAARKEHVDDANTLVESGTRDVDMLDAADGEGSNDENGVGESDMEEDEEEDEQEEGEGEEDDEDEEDAADSEHGASDEEREEHSADKEEPLSFGELLMANAPDIIDIEASMPGGGKESTSLSRPKSERQLQAPSAASLGTVLTQALRTNDRDLLEVCFQMQDLDSVRSTLDRLPSPLVGTLLQKLAERLHKSPGRAGPLMVWVQWALVSHGGYLAGQPDVLKKLHSLNRVLRLRANGLQSLLVLKGKLDMLHAQMGLRRNMQKAAAVGEDNDETVIYVEGQEEQSSEDDEAHDHSEGNAEEQLLSAGGQSRSRAKGSGEPSSEQPLDTLNKFLNAEGSEVSEEMPTTQNGVLSDGAEGSEGGNDFDTDEEDDDDDDDDEDLIDDEAEETENDSGGDEDFSEVESEEYDSGDAAEGVDSIEPAIPPPSNRSKQRANR